MKNTFGKIAFIALCAIVVNTTLLAQFTLSGEYRPRAEYRHGYKALPATGQEAAFFIDQRTRLNFDYKSSSYRFFLSFQDVRVWGAQRQLVVNDGLTTTLHQAFAEVYFSEHLSLKAGRQEIIYDDHRIFGNVGWAQQARSHDAAIFSYTANGWKADLGLAYNQNRAGLSGTTYSLPDYKTFQYLHLNKSWPRLNFSFLVLNNGFQVVDLLGNPIKGVHYTQTAGTYLGIKTGKLMTHLSLYYQGGHLADSAGAPLSAHLLGIDLAYKADDHFTLVGGFERQSGNSQVEPAEESHAFTPYFGTNHKFNGFMDYFYVGNHIGSVGLQDAYVKIKYKKDKFSAGIDVHYFLAAADVSDGQGGAMDPALGTEIDTYLGTKLAEGVGIKMGYSHLLPTETMQALKGGDLNETANWAYAMLVVKPTLFKGKK